MNIYVIYQPGALDVRDISEHFMDELDHRYGRAHVSGTGRAGDANAHATALARAQVVITLIGPSWSANADARVMWELDQALARRTMLVPALLSGAALPPPEAPALAALATRQTVAIRPDPEMANDLNKLFGEVNTQLGWAPMSGGLLAGAALLALVTAAFLATELTYQTNLAAIISLPWLALEALLAGVGLWVAWKRRAPWWAVALVTGVVAEAADVVYLYIGTGNWPWWLNVLLTLVFPLALLAFALFGPRRELQRLTPPRIWRTASRAAA